MYKNTNKVVVESAEVVIRVKDSKTDVIKFRHRGTEYKVTKNLSAWKEVTGDNIITHYHMICEKICCELAHDHKNNTWTLIQIDNIRV